jgi:phage major head subunit gpT-like protein
LKGQRNSVADGWWRAGKPRALKVGRGHRPRPTAGLPVLRIDEQAVDRVFKGVRAASSDACMEAPKDAGGVAQTVPQACRDETCGGPGAVPRLRAWTRARQVQARQVQARAAHGVTTRTLPSGSPVAVKRRDRACDRIGLSAPVFAEMGQVARRHKEELIFGLLKKGFSTPCQGGQSFFDTDHPVTGAGGAVATVARTDGGRLPGVRPTVLVAPPAREDKALTPRDADCGSGGAWNPWTGPAPDPRA